MNLYSFVQAMKSNLKSEIHGRYADIGQGVSEACYHLQCTMSMFPYFIMLGLMGLSKSHHMLLHSLYSFFKYILLSTDATVEIKHHLHSNNFITFWQEQTKFTEFID